MRLHLPTTKFGGMWDALINMHRPQIAEFVTQQHLPSVFVHREWLSGSIGEIMYAMPSSLLDTSVRPAASTLIMY